MWLILKCNTDALTPFSVRDEIYTLFQRCCSRSIWFLLYYISLTLIYNVIIAFVYFHLDFFFFFFLGIYVSFTPTWCYKMTCLRCKTCILHTLLEVCPLVLLDISQKGKYPGPVLSSVHNTPKKHQNLISAGRAVKNKPHKLFPPYGFYHYYSGAGW